MRPDLRELEAEERGRGNAQETQINKMFTIYVSGGGGIPGGGATGGSAGGFGGSAVGSAGKPKEEGP